MPSSAASRDLETEVSRLSSKEGDLHLGHDSAGAPARQQ
jgi:hypothetical protein